MTAFGHTRVQLGFPDLGQLRLPRGWAADLAIAESRLLPGACSPATDLLAFGIIMVPGRASRIGRVEETTRIGLFAG